MSDTPKATAADAQLILQLYDLRREPEMRKARTYMATQFWPQCADDVLALMNSFPGQENAWMRQVIGYWDMAAALVLHGAIDRDLFVDASGGEMYFVFAKISPFLAEVREKSGQPGMLGNIEKVLTATDAGKQRLAMVEKRVQGMAANFAKK